MRYTVLFVVGCAVGCVPALYGGPQWEAEAAHQEDPMEAGCRANVQRMVGTYCAHPPSPLPSGYAESVRRGYESQKEACSPEVLEPLATCVADLEAIVLAEDPNAPARREAAREDAEAMRQDPTFLGLIESWLEALDAMKIICRDERVSDSHRRECERTRGDLHAVEDTLRELLLGAGFDPRDLGELGLWPSDPNPYDR